MITWTEEEKAYYAAFLDGEGCVYITSEGYVAVNFTNTNPVVLREIANHYNTVLSHRKSPSPKAKDYYRVQLSSRRAFDFLSNIFDYTTIKRERVELALEHLTIGGKVPNDIVERFRHLNKKGMA